ncbi:hypothetical protein [Pelagicoccus sp. SDUM812003]|uniref:hypothetical protein n=1 Tax=Pelagicoccus sp. SDUM812003 TaxID=3041267 RepID=UPI00280C6FC3|nr:hypothetical protein [Pelagicoccus sp. SDUM812003]MDQ8201988.1 hypothetical protein [Pelagicoccus sp. SDUM812003]
MDRHVIAALMGNTVNNAITDVLGVVAVCAFIGVAIYIGVLMLRETATRKPITVTGKSIGGIDAQAHPAKPKATEQQIDSSKLIAERHFADFYDGLVEMSQEVLEELSVLADGTFDQLASAYSANSYGLEGENSAVRSSKFAAVCERQWSYFRSDIAFMTHMDVQEHLKHILENHRMFSNQNASGDMASMEVSPEILRTQELVALLRVVTKEKVRPFQETTLSVAQEFSSHYEKELKKPVQDMLSKVNSEMRNRHQGVRLSDTPYYDRVRQLKNHLEMITCITERIGQNTQRINQESLALSQIIYIGALLRILANITDWFACYDRPEVPQTQQTSKEDSSKRPAKPVR